ncbi:MAG: hypothetical protein JNM31_03035 [Flavobacteriales bacterium]|nr:hypothetical protein [Flavobacteriales bacterium]
MLNDRDLLIAKLDAFIRRYYTDRLIRGGLYSIGLLVAFYLVVSLAEQVGRFTPRVRTVLVATYLIATLVVLVRFILIPLVKLYRLGPVISHAEAARIIGAHFGEVRDKLLNTLQLADQVAQEPERRDLIEASIAQRAHELRPVPFQEAIDLRRNRRHLRWALPPVAILVGLLVASPSLITAPTKRLIKFSEEFLPEAPFRFVLLNDSLTVRSAQDIEVRLELDGIEVPQRVEIDLNGTRVPMVRADATHFTHLFRNVRADIPFRFTAEGFLSAAHTVLVTPDPLLVDLVLELQHPEYLGLPDARVANAGDITIPAGTRVRWTMNTHSADRLLLQFEDSTLMAQPAGEDRFTASRRFLRSQAYHLRPLLGELPSSADIGYRVEVVPDLYPTIGVEERVDSLDPKRVYFRGDIGDDHGFRRLQFHYRFTEGGDSVAADQRQRVADIAIDARNLRQSFYHRWDLSELRIGLGDRIEYWFEVWDNDGVNGSKSARTPTRLYQAPTLRELAEEQDRTNEKIKQDLSASLKEAQQLQRDLDKLRREFLDKKDLNWQDKQKLQNAMERQKELQQRIERTTNELRMDQQRQQQFREVDERILEKQRQVQELFENVLSEEMKKLYEQVQQMMEKLDKDALQKQLDEMKLGQEDIEKELDRTLELFKQMEVEQKALDIAEQLEKLAEQQEKLSEETKEGRTPQEELQRKQDELNKAFEEVRKQMDELEQKNQELEKPMDLPNTEGQEKDIQQQQQQSSDQLQKKQNQKAGESQQKAAEQMEQLAFQMKSAMDVAQQEQQEEDMDALRQLLENLLHLSFGQEELMAQVERTTTRDPRFVQLGRTQKKLRDDAKVVEDSLFALSKRVPQLQATVNREMNAVYENMDRAMAHLGEARANEREKAMAGERQQRSMTSLNNLALLLDEALQQMQAQQQQNQSGKPGSGSCKKPGGQGSQPSMGKMRAQQQALQKQLDEMRKALEKGQKPGDKPGQKPGEKNQGGLGAPGMSQQLAQLAAQQAAIRKEMQRMAQELNKDGSGAGNELNKLAEELEKVEKDIVNKRIDQETMKRQQDILVRMLEHEKAEREREQDNKRESREGQQTPPPDPARFFEYQRDRQREAEMLRTLPPGLRPYYRQRVNDYFGTFDQH